MPMLCHSTDLLFNAETQHSLALPKLCLSPPCPCSALLLTASTALFNTSPVPIHARTLHRYSMPLLRYARLDLSVQCLSDTILVIAIAQPIPSMPLLFCTLPLLLKSTPLRSVTLLCLLTAVHGLCMSCPFYACTKPIYALPKQLTDSPCRRNPELLYSMPLHFTAIASIKHFPLKSAFAGIAPLS